MKTNQRKILLAAFIVLVMFGQTWTQADTIYVATDGDDTTGDGSFGNPYETIQKGIDEAINDDTVIAADGVYSGPGNRDIDFLGKAITVRSENGPEECIIFCNLEGRGFYFDNGEDANSIVDGFTIVAGKDYYDPGGPIPISTYGGGIYCGGFVSPTIRNCIITESDASFGGGIFSYGSPTIINCLICNNSGYYGAGIWCDSNMKILNCTIVGNWGFDSGGVDGSGGQVINSIVWSNIPNQIAGNQTVRYSDVQGSWTGEGNIDADPLFVYPVPLSLDGIRRLLPGSPCIDAGTNSTNPPLPSTDLDGNPRIINGTVDMGAYEFQGIVYVDDDAPDDPGPGDPTISDPLEDGTEAHPFDTIQEGIDVAQDDYTVLVYPGQYLEADPYSYDDINFLGKNIRLTSTNPTDPNIVNNTIIGGTVLFNGTEDANCMLTGFKIYNLGYGAVYGQNTHATISYCIISGNGPCGATVIKDCDGTISNCSITDNITVFLCGVDPVVFGCKGSIKNCTIADNVSGLSVGNATIENSIIYNNNDGGSQIAVENEATLNISYSNVQGGLGGIVGAGTVNWGPGNIDTDPCFAQLGYWEEEPWELVEGDYHLQSQAGRWDPNQNDWVYDANTSRCIDAGNPGCPLGEEPNDANNIRINMGAYGGTVEASKSPANWALLADLTNDGIANFADLAEQTEDWLKSASEQPGDLNRDGVVNGIDFSLLASDWQQIANWDNLSPDVDITEPEDGFTFYWLLESVWIRADAWDLDGSVVKVEFFVNGEKWGEDNDGTDGWEMVTSFDIGTYILTAKATDNDGATTTSPPVTITATTTSLPDVDITEPQDEDVISWWQETIPIIAWASDSDGSVINVEFFANGSKLTEVFDGFAYHEEGSDIWEFTWVSHQVGTYILTAKATDDLGATRTSPAVGITVVP